MGPYLSQPKKEKETHSGQGRNIVFASSEMQGMQVIPPSIQGWRNTMEDAAITIAELNEDTSVFGVFDGHGGREVAKFVERHFIEELQKNAAFKAKDFEKALYETFLKMDELIMTPAGQKEVLSLKASGEDECMTHCDASPHRIVCRMHRQRGTHLQDNAVRGECW